MAASLQSFHKLLFIVTPQWHNNVQTASPFVQSGRKVMSLLDRFNNFKIAIKHIYMSETIVYV